MKNLEKTTLTKPPTDRYETVLLAAICLFSVVALVLMLSLPEASLKVGLVYGGV